MSAAPTTVNGGRVAKNTTYLTLALIGQKVLSALYIPVVAGLIGPSAIGEYLGALSFINIFAIFIDLGLLPAFIRQTARDPAAGQRDYNLIVTFKIGMAVLVSAAIFTMVMIFNRSGLSHPDIIFLRWAALGMALDAITATGYGYFRGLQRLEFESIGTVLHRVMVMLVGLLALHLGAPTVVVMIALVAGSAINFLYATFHLWRQGLSWRPTWNAAELRSMLKIALPFAVAALFTALYANSDTFLLQIFKSHRDVGLYGTANKMVIAFQIIPAALVGAIYPAMSAAFMSDKQKLQRLFVDSMRYLMVVFIPVMVVIAVLAHPLVLQIYKKTWIDAVWPLRMLALGLPFLFLHYPVGYLLNAANQQTRNTWNIAITVIVNIGLNLLFIRQYSYISVSIISVFSSILLFCLGLFYARRQIVIPAKELFGTLGKTLTAGLFLAAIGAGLVPYAKSIPSVLGVTMVMGLAYLVLLFALRIVRRHDVNFLLNRLRRS
jgi:O-antigen/teichoic acid export membrane protein